MANVLRIVLAACAALTLGAARAQTPAAPPTENSLFGIWSSDTVTTPGLSGELAVSHSEDGWHAAIAGDETDFRGDAGNIRFAFPNGQGSFRGRFAPGSDAISGFWIQPSGWTHDSRDAGGSGEPFASPLTLRRVAPNLWRGDVHPLEDRFTLYLKIFRGADGALLGAFRNPDMNSHGGAMQFQVARNGNDIAFTTPPDFPRAPIRLDAKLLSSPDRLSVAWPDLGRDIELVRATPEAAANFYPRPPGAQPYAYRAPPTVGDGWATARATDVGMDEPVLARLVQRIAASDPAALRPQLIHSLLIARHGKLVLEEYFFGYDRERVHDLRSAGKTFASVLMGAAMREGVAVSPDTKLYDILASMGPFANPDPRKREMTLAELMTHTSGLACDDASDVSPGNEDTMQGQRRQPDWWKYTLDLAVVHDPGSRYAYCSAGMNLVGAALTTATRTWLPELFDRMIARPLQFGPWYWDLMPTGEGYLGGGAYMQPRDLLKIGQLYLDGGVWNGKRIVDPSWIALSTAPHVRISPETTGLSAVDFSNFYAEGEDGYAWHLSTFEVGGRAYREYAAAGNGGQILSVVPDLDLAVVFTAGNYMQGGIWGRFRTQILPQEIVPAIRH